MASEILEGETLGEKHRYYNKLIKQFSSKDGSQEIQKINYDEPDLNNLYKIDKAAIKKNVEYIVEVLKCEDLLYVSRALKRSLWLITDTEYAHIINPSYLYSQLLPQMTSKAGHKLLLSIRLNLKDEKRVEEFYNYYEEKKELEMALKWLPTCSTLFIEKAVEKHAEKIPCSIILKLCERSFTILQICIRKKDGYDRRNLLSQSAFLLNNYTKAYLDIVEAQKLYSIPHFSPKSTLTIMKNCPEVIINNFEKFATKIDIPTFAKCFKEEDIKDFLITQFKNKKLKTWFTFENVVHFIARMPTEGRFDFIKRIFIDKTYDNKIEDFCSGDDENAFDRCIASYSLSPSVSQSSNANIYRWYRFAPFVTAFIDLKKLIRLESNANERNAMFLVLMTSARQNLKNVQAVLQYYRDKHINEPFKFKSHFINIVLSHSNSHRFDDKTWGILNDIFCSMEVYSDSENNVQACLKHIIVYKVVNGLKVPDIVEKKFELDNLKSLQSKLNEEEKEKVFNYLYEYMITKIQNNAATTESDFKEFKKHIMNILNLLVDWNKDILEHCIVLEKIKELIQIKVNKSWNEDLSDIYNVKKSWRKHMFRESLLLQPTQETCINALKHGPQILDVYKKEIFQNDSMSLTKILKKIRIYWPQSLTKTFKDTFLNQLNDTTKHKIAVQGICILLRQKQLIEIITKYRPESTKIKWGETDELALSIQKYFAKYMYLARPQPPVELVLLYAKGDYLQYALPSVYSILFNMSAERSMEHVPKFLDAPVSLQKHGLQFAFTKLKTNELLKTCLTTWESNKNASIRATVFKLIFDLLCKEQNETIIKEIWSVLSTFIDTLKFDENKTMFVILGNAEKVPLSVKQAYCIKSYRYLKSLPAKANCDEIIESVICGTLDIMESLDLEFVAEMISDMDDKFATQQYFTLTKVISVCLLSTKSETVQTQRYEIIFVPLLVRYFDLLEITENKKHLKYNFNDCLTYLHKGLPDIVLKKDMITPTKLFNDIYCSLESKFSIEDYYVLIMTWKLAAEYMKIFNKYRWDDVETEENATKWDIICLKTAPEFGKLCMEQLKEEINKYFPSIHRLFSKALKEICERFQFTYEIKLSIIKSIQIHADIMEGHLLVIKLIPKYLPDNKDIEERAKIYEVLRSHPSAEVRMPFQQILRDGEYY